MYRILTNHSIIPFDKDSLLDSMYRGFMDAVDDPFTYYFDRESLRSFTNRTDGTFAGVGMLVTLSQYNQVTVVTVFSGSPAEENGMLPGDVLLAVDGNPSEGLRLEEVTGAVQGTPGTDVTLSILRNDYEFDVTITRRIIQVPSVEHRMLEDNIGFLRLISFDGVTYNQFRAAYEDLEAQGLEGLVIDLRNNTGGRLQTVVDISSMLIPAGVIMYSENANGERTVFESESEDYIGLPLVILVNESSASASEVLAGAVRDHNTGTIVGQQTFGKGVVQSIHTLSDGSGISVTVAEYFTPNGISIHGYGLTPDYIVEVDRETAFMAARLTLEEDIQLQKALEVLNGKLD
jgi:carboxyl-terminal processing protease